MSKGYTIDIWIYLWMPHTRWKAFFYSVHLGVTVPPPPALHPTLHSIPSSVSHCPPDSHPSTWAQFKKPFNSCHSTGLAISPAARAQTGTQPQRAAQNVRSVPPRPNRLEVKDCLRVRLS